MGAVELTRYGTLRVRWKRNEEDLRPDYQLSELAKLFEDFVSAVTPPGSKPSFFGFKDAIVASPGEAAAFMQTFSRRAAALLEGFDQWSTTHEVAKVGNSESAGAKRIGIGLYLLHADLQSASKLIARSRVRGERRARKRST
ncbi:MAG: hypothetical protein WBW93_06965 [Steroidobacteraceae bacterium]